MKKECKKRALLIGLGALTGYLLIRKKDKVIDTIFDLIDLLT